MTEANRDELPIAGLRVLELSDHEGVQYCGRTLASLGADVAKGEMPEGDPLRRRPPFATDHDGVGRSIPFEYLNAGKHSVVVDPTTPDGQQALVRLLRWADVVLVTPEWRDVVDAVARPAHQLRALAGSFGGRAVEDAPSTSFTRLHAATSGYLVPADKDRSVRPGWGGPYVFESMFGTALAVAVMSELQRGEGGELDFTYQGYGVWMDKMFFPRVSRGAVPDLHRYVTAYPFGGSMTCADGFACVFVIEEHQWRSFARAIGHPEWLDDPRMSDGVRRIAVQEEIDGALVDWCAERTVDEVLATFRQADVPVARVRRPSEVLAWDQLRQRGFIAEADTAFGRLPVANLPFGPGVPVAPATPSPRLGADRVDEVEARGAGRRRLPGPWHPGAEERGGPFAGLKVLDFTWAAAGPIATSVLAYLGADVAKVEVRSRPDLMRLAEKQYGYSDSEDLDSSPAFHEIAAGKRSIELDLTRERDRETALRLAATADVLIENMRPGKIESLGLSYEIVSRVNPGIVMCSQSATARVEGPGVPGYAPIFWAEGGGSWQTGWPDRRPGVVRGPVDLHAAACALLGVLALLERRRRTGRGGYVDCSAIETVCAAFGPQLLAAAVTGTENVRCGNAFPGTVFNDVLPAHGDDQWVAVTARDAGEWAALRAALGLSTAPPPSSAEEAAAAYAELAAVTARWDPNRLEARLSAAGVPAARSLSLRAALGDARLAGRGVWQTIHTPVLGDQVIVGLPWTFDGTPYDLARPGPNLGEHSALILKEWLGE